MDVSVNLILENKCHKSDITAVKVTNTKLFSGSGDKMIRSFNHFNGNLQESLFSPIEGHKYYVNALAINLTENYLASGSTDGNICVWLVATGEKITTLSHPSRKGIRSLNFSLNSRLLISGSEDGSVCLWECGLKWTLLKTLWKHENICYCVLVTPDTEAIITGSTAGDLRVWDCRNLNFAPEETFSNFTKDNKIKYQEDIIYQSDCHDLGVFNGAMSSVFHITNEKMLYNFATCGGDNNLKVWKLEVPRNTDSFQKWNLVLMNTLKRHSRIVTCCDYSSDGVLIVSVSMDHYLIIWNALNGSVLCSVEAEDNYVNCCSISDNGKYVVTGGQSSKVKLWSLSYDRNNISLNQEQSETKTDKFTEIINEQSSATKNKKHLDVKNRVLLPLVSAENWSTDQVVSFISQTTGLVEYNRIWYQHAINGSTFLSLTEDDLERKLDIKLLGHRRTIAKLITDLKNVIKRDSLMLPSTSHSGLILPNEVYCPITHEIMRDPVIAADGFSYERQAIEDWIITSGFQPRSPMTNQILTNRNLVPNYILKKLITDFSTK